ncbi:MAG: universal stress protein [Flavobacteriales bacterium]|nr:universal stress protein [Flavobacteriales bacterium]
MKTIILPTDFSACSDQAIDYAIGLFGKTATRFYLVHVYQIPLTYPSAVIPGLEILKEKAEQDLQKKAEELKGRLSAELICQAYEGDVVDVIGKMAKKETEALVVMGAHGMSPMREFLAGSHAVDCIRHLPCPVIIVPEKAQVHSPEKILFASDAESEGGVDAPDALAAFARHFNARLTVVHVNEKSMASVQSATHATLGKAYDGLKVEFREAAGDDVSEAIGRVADETGAHLVAMVAHHRKLMERIFHKSVTRQVAISTHIPLISFPVAG